MEIIVLVFLIMGIAVFFIIKNKQDLPDPSTMKEVTSNQVEDKDDDLTSSLGRDLYDLRKSDVAKKKETKTRKDFIQKKYKIIASFYNNYKFIDYKKKTNIKIAKKQMTDIVNILEPTLYELEEFFGQDSDEIDYKIILVGVITFKLMKKETLKKVNLDLIKLHEMGELLDFDHRLMRALRDILNPLGLIA